MRFLVTGGAGFIGHHLVRKLIELGHEVTALDNERSGRWSQVDSAARRVNADLENCSDEFFEKTLRDVDVVFHLAAEKYNSSSATPQRVLAVNVMATDRLYQAAVKAKIKRIIFTSSLYAYGTEGPAPMVETDIPKAWTHYGLSKIAGEMLLEANCRGSQTSWNVARLLFIYGPGQYAEGGYKSVIVSNLERLQNGKRVTVRGDGKQELDYVYVDDCVDALVKLSDSANVGEIVNVASGKPVSINHVLETLCEVNGVNFEPETLTPDWTAGTIRSGSNQKIKKMFNWTPTTSLVTGLTNIKNWSENSDQ